MGHDSGRAKALLAEAGYDGRPVVLLQATDIPILNGATLVTAQALRKAGMTVEVQAMDWSTLTSRRTVTAPPGEGGWNLFLTWAIGADAMNPVLNIALSGGCRERAWFGWPCDGEIGRLRDQFARAEDAAERKRLAEAVQTRAFEIVAYGSFGRWFNPVAYRDSLAGMIKSPVPFFWNIEKR